VAVISGVVLYILIWWTALFTVLPWGNRAGPVALGHAPSAPARPRLKQKLLATTIVAALLWVPAQYAVTAVLDDMRVQARIMADEDHGALTKPQ
jgi:predicted secreted protein